MCTAAVYGIFTLIAMFESRVCDHNVHARYSGRDKSVRLQLFFGGKVEPKLFVNGKRVEHYKVCVERVTAIFLIVFGNRRFRG